MFNGIGLYLCIGAFKGSEHLFQSWGKFIPFTCYYLHLQPWGEVSPDLSHFHFQNISKYCKNYIM